MGGGWGGHKKSKGTEAKIMEEPQALTADPGLTRGGKQKGGGGGNRGVHIRNTLKGGTRKLSQTVLISNLIRLIPQRRGKAYA